MQQDLEASSALSTLISRVVVTACLLLVSVSCGPARRGISDTLPEKPILADAPGSPIPIPFPPGGVVISDVNNDHLPDLVVRSSESPELIVLLGTGGGNFSAAPASPVRLRVLASEIAHGDINGDGWMDLVLGSHDSYNIELLVGDGTGNFLPAPNSPVRMKDGQHPHTHGLALGDLNNDGRLDLVIGNTTDSDVAVALGDGDGGFTLAADSPFAVGQGPYPLTIDDLNADGNLDVAVTSTLNANGQSGESLTVLLGDGKGGFRRSQVPVRTLDPWFVAVGDVNSDGIPDLVSTHWERTKLTVLIGGGDGSFTEVSESPFDLNRPIWYVGITDFDGDGNRDVVAAADDSVRLVFGDGQGNFELEAGSTYPTSGGTWRLAVGDVNGDGRSDVVAPNLTGDNLTVLLAR